MKYLIFYLLFLHFICPAQGNLQFNQVRFMTYQTSGVQDQSFTLDVPAGKTLKIESAGINGNSANLSKRMFLLLNGVIIAGGLVPEDSFNSTDNEFAYYPIHFPIWLPAGAFTIKIPSNSNSSPMTAFISGIEFNIVP